MPWSETLPQFSLAGTLLTVLLLFFAAFGEPYLGRRAFAWLSRRRDTDANALVRVHAVTMGVHALWGVLVVAVLFTSPGLAAADLGFRLPHALGPVVGGALGGLLALAALWVLVNGLPSWLRGRLPQGGAKGRKRGGRRAAADRPASLPEPERDRWLLIPYTRNERLVAVGAAVTGGLCAELLYRGLFIVLLASMGVPLWFGAVLSVLLFAVAYLYQGWWGLVSAGASGTLFVVLYLGTGSLWVPVLVHVALNLRSLAFPPAALREESYAYDDYEDEDGGGDDGSAPATPPHGTPALESPLAPPPPGTGPHPAAPAGALPSSGGPQFRPDAPGTPALGPGTGAHSGPQSQPGAPVADVSTPVTGPHSPAPAWGTPAGGSPSFGGPQFQSGAPGTPVSGPGAGAHSGPQPGAPAWGAPTGGSPSPDGPRPAAPAWGTPAEGSPSFGGPRSGAPAWDSSTGGFSAPDGPQFRPAAPGAGAPMPGTGPHPVAPAWGTPAEGSPSFGGTEFRPGAPGAPVPGPGAGAHSGPQAGAPAWDASAGGAPSFGGTGTGPHTAGPAWGGDTLGGYDGDFLGGDPADGDGNRPLYPDERIDRRFGDR